MWRGKDLRVNALRREVNIAKGEYKREEGAKKRKHRSSREKEYTVEGKREKEAQTK